MKTSQNYILITLFLSLLISCANPTSDSSDFEDKVIITPVKFHSKFYKSYNQSGIFHDPSALFLEVEIVNNLGKDFVLISESSYESNLKYFCKGAGFILKMPGRDREKLFVKKRSTNNHLLKIVAIHQQNLNTLKSMSPFLNDSIYDLKLISSDKKNEIIIDKVPHDSIKVVYYFNDTLIDEDDSRFYMKQDEGIPPPTVEEYEQRIKS